MLKYAIYHSNLFENFGFKYLGPIDGHNLDELTEALMVAKMMHKPCLVHIYTKKEKAMRLPKTIQVNITDYRQKSTR